MHDILRRFADEVGRQIDPKVRDRLRVFADEGFAADDLKALIDEARLDVLADEFVIHALESIWEWKLREEGRTRPR